VYKDRDCQAGRRNRPGYGRATSRAIALGAVLASHGLLLLALSLTHTVMPPLGGTVAEVSLLQDPGVPSESPPPIPKEPLIMPRPEVVVALLTPIVMQVEAMPDVMPEPSATGVRSAAGPAGGAVAAPDADRVVVPDLDILCPDRRGPGYPPESRRLREQGEVTLHVELDEHGAVSLASVIRSSGHARLDDAARRTVLAWHCEPARRGGRAVPAAATQSLEFVLERRAGGGRRG